MTLSGEPVTLSVVVPVYKSTETLESLAERLVGVLDGLGVSHELVFVEDGSGDASWQALCRVQERWPDRVVAIQLMRNFGQHNALMCGFRHVRGEFVVTMDDDLQHPPEEVPKLLAAIQVGDLDLVYGAYDSKKHAAGRNLGSALVVLFYRTVFKNGVTPGAFRIMRRPLVDAVLSYDLNFTYIDGLLAWNTSRIGQTPVEHHPRAAGKSRYSLGKLLVLAANLFTNFSLLPLQLASGIGVCSALCGFAVGMWYLVQTVLHRITVPGYASTIVAVLMLGGLQLCALGIIGEYIGRLHLNVNRKPQYTIRQIVRK